MTPSSVRHHNVCPRCPIVGEENQPKDERYQFLTLGFNIRIAREMVRQHMLHRVDSSAQAQWLESTHIVEEHIDHLPADLGPGVMVTLPNDLGRLVIDGNHRAARALRNGEEFLAYLLPVRETRILLRRSLGRKYGRALWKRLKNSKPHPADRFQS